MIIVIIAGGSGTRLWPLSTPEYPKHLLKINDDKKSLLQHTYERAKSLSVKVYVVSEASHTHHVREQLAELKKEAFIVEPARRGTANCIVAALNYIKDKHNPNEAIIFLSADHYIRDQTGFVHSFKIAAKTSEAASQIVLVGVEPDRPETGFGYIKKGGIFDEERFVFKVDSFKEKPDFETAKQYVKSGDYLWNCGYFVGSVSTFLKSMKDYAPKLFANYQKLERASKKTYNDIYLSFESMPIDYALIEKIKGLLVVPASFDWMDLGSYGDLHKAVGSDEHGNHIYGTAEIEEVENSFIHNTEGKPVAVVGLDNVVIVNTPSGILVTRKDLAQKVGEVSKRITSKES